MQLRKIQLLNILLQILLLHIEQDETKSTFDCTANYPLYILFTINNTKVVCGGLLLSLKHVLTIKSCFGQKLSKYKAVFGAKSQINPKQVRNIQYLMQFNESPEDITVALLTPEFYRVPYMVDYYQPAEYKQNKSILYWSTGVSVKEAVVNNISHATFNIQDPLMCQKYKILGYNNDCDAWDNHSRYLCGNLSEAINYRKPNVVGGSPILVSTSKGLEHFGIRCMTYDKILWYPEYTQFLTYWLYNSNLIKWIKNYMEDYPRSACSIELFHNIGQIFQDKILVCGASLVGKQRVLTSAACGSKLQNGKYALRTRGGQFVMEELAHSKHNMLMQFVVHHTEWTSSMIFDRGHICKEGFIINGDRCTRMVFNEDINLCKDSQLKEGYFCGLNVLSGPWKIDTGSPVICSNGHQIGVVPEVKVHRETGKWWSYIKTDQYQDFIGESYFTGEMITTETNIITTTVTSVKTSTKSTTSKNKQTELKAKSRGTQFPYFSANSASSNTWFKVIWKFTCVVVGLNTF